MTTFAPDLIDSFAREWAEWRLGGCPGYGFQKSFKSRAEKAARKVGRSYSELWAAVHKAAYALIDADPRSALR
jgi:GTP-binding protein EngB required for normal cell division